MNETIDELLARLESYYRPRAVDHDAYRASIEPPTQAERNRVRYLLGVGHE